MLKYDIKLPPRGLSGDGIEGVKEAWMNVHGNWGMAYLEWEDHDGQHHEVKVPAKLLFALRRPSMGKKRRRGRYERTMMAGHRRRRARGRSRRRKSRRN